MYFIILHIPQKDALMESVVLTPSCVGRRAEVIITSKRKANDRAIVVDTLKTTTLISLFVT